MLVCYYYRHRISLRINIYMYIIFYENINILSSRLKQNRFENKYNTYQLFRRNYNNRPYDIVMYLNNVLITRIRSGLCGIHYYVRGRSLQWFEKQPGTKFYSPRTSHIIVRQNDDFRKSLLFYRFNDMTLQ